MRFPVQLPDRYAGSDAVSSGQRELLHLSLIHISPIPTPTPEATPTPEVTPTPEPVVEQTASGVNVTKQDGTYVANADINLRADASADATWIAGVTSGTQLTSTGAVSYTHLGRFYPNSVAVARVF